MWQDLILIAISLGFVVAMMAGAAFVMSALRTLPRPLMLTQTAVCGLVAVTILRNTLG